MWTSSTIMEGTSDYRFSVPACCGQGVLAVPILTTLVSETRAFTRVKPGTESEVPEL